MGIFTYSVGDINACGLDLRNMVDLPQDLVTSQLTQLAVTNRFVLSRLFGSVKHACMRMHARDPRMTRTSEYYETCLPGNHEIKLGHNVTFLKHRALWEQYYKFFCLPSPSALSVCGHLVT